MFGGQRITEYTCSTNKTVLQWIVEPLVGRVQNRIRFTAGGNPGGTAQRGNIIGIQDSTFPLVSRLRITSNPSLPAADVVCSFSNINVTDTRPYFMDAFSKLHNNNNSFPLKITIV